MFLEEYEIIKEKGAPPLSSSEVKERLKHIAGLCYGLVCDFGNAEIEAEDLRKKIEVLKAELRNERKCREQLEEKLYRIREKNGQLTPKEIERRKEARRAYMRDYYRKHKENSVQREKQNGKPPQGGADAPSDI